MRNVLYRTPPRPPLKSGSPGSKSELFRDYMLLPSIIHSLSSFSAYVSAIMITRILSRYSQTLIPLPTRPTHSSIPPFRHPQVVPQLRLRRTFAAKTSADEQVEELQELSVSDPSDVPLRNLTTATATQRRKTSSRSPRRKPRRRPFTPPTTERPPRKN